MKREKELGELAKYDVRYTLDLDFANNGQVSQVWFGSLRGGEGETAADEANYAFRLGYFLRKGFSDAVKGACPDTFKPILIDKSGKYIDKEMGMKEIISGIYDGKVAVGGFKVSKIATPEQVAEGYKNMVTHFVNASHNADFDPDGGRRQFEVGGLENSFGGSGNRFIYSNENPENKIDFAEVIKELGLAKVQGREV